MSTDSVAVSNLDGKGEELAATFWGRLEEGQAEDLLVQVQRHVAAQLLGVVAQNLQEVKLVNQSMKLAVVPANSDTIGTRQKCHCRQTVL